MYKKNIAKRLANARELMAVENIDALIVPSSDNHFSEYVADHYKFREYLSGFSGSAGTLVITAEDAALWTDSRYFLQAGQQLQGSGIKLMKEGLEETPPMGRWITETAGPGKTVGFDGDLFSVDAVAVLQGKMPDMELKAISSPAVRIWDDRPPLAGGETYFPDEEITGESCTSKLSRVRYGLDLDENTVYVMSVLDQIAWLFNMRGTDIDYNMVSLAYALIYCDRAVLFIDPEKLSGTKIESLAHDNIEVVPYDSFRTFLSAPGVTRVLYNPSQTSYANYTRLVEMGCTLIREPDSYGIVNTFKAVKNETEIEGFKKAVLEDGIALTRFYMWLEGLLKRGAVSSEKQISDKLHEFRSQSDAFIRESFESIVGFRANGAIVHYAVTDLSSATVDGSGFLLIDSGAHYRYGTTDITRTVHLGIPTEEEKTDFTLVLMGHIDLASAVFTAGTCGTQLDILAREPLMKHGLNYMHGTGHGIGHCLNVHEGPFAVRKEYNPVPLRPGMVLSNEPGLYREGKWGIRTENMMLVTSRECNGFGTFYGFETLSLCFIDTKSIRTEMLNTPQEEFLNRYHSTVYHRLAPYLTPEEKQFLAEKCKAIS